MVPVAGGLNVVFRLALGDGVDGSGCAGCGHSGQWRGVLDEAGQRRYLGRVSALVAPYLAGGVRRG